MSELHSAFGSQQCTPWRGTAVTTRNDCIPEGFRHSPPSYKRELATNGEGLVEDLEVITICLFSVQFCVHSLTFIICDPALNIYILIRRHCNDSKD